MERCLVHPLSNAPAPLSAHVHHAEPETPSPSANDDPRILNARTARALLQRVRAMIDQSEQRQQERTRQLALRLSQVRERSTRSTRRSAAHPAGFRGSSRSHLGYLVKTSGRVK